MVVLRSFFVKYNSFDGRLRYYFRINYQLESGFGICIIKKDTKETEKRGKEKVKLRKE